MRFICRVAVKDGLWTAEHTSANVGPVRVSAPTRDEVLRKLEAEIRHWLEICPCTGNAYQHVEIELVQVH
jgi:hypothetical protein